MVDENENRPVRDVHHPRKQLYETCSGRSGFRYTIGKGVCSSEILVVFGLEGRIVLLNGHGRRSYTSLKMLFPSFGFEEKRRSQENCLLSENRMIVTYDRFCKPFTAARRVRRHLRTVRSFSFRKANHGQVTVSYEADESSRENFISNDHTRPIRVDGCTSVEEFGSGLRLLMTIMGCPKAFRYITSPTIYLNECRNS